jgi:hypothetical protein
VPKYGTPLNPISKSDYKNCSELFLVIQNSSVPGVTNPLEIILAEHKLRWRVVYLTYDPAKTLTKTCGLRSEVRTAKRLQRWSDFGAQFGVRNDGFSSMN